jgi:hypothetical protein
MNLEQLKKDVGYRVRLAPRAFHLDEAGEPSAMPDEDWIIMAVTDSYVEISAPSGHFYRLGKDHVVSFYTEPNRSAEGLSYGILQLKVQLYIQGANVTITPTHLPGQPVPPMVNTALRARGAFVPEIERIFRRQVQILDRVAVNFITTAAEYLGKTYEVRPNDTWESLRPTQSRLFPDSPVYRELSGADAAMLAEFYTAVAEVTDLIDHWVGTVALTEYNHWNVLMHKVENSLRLGELVVQRFCPDRQFDATMPSSGTLLARSQTALAHAAQIREIWMKKFNEFFAAQKQQRLQRPPRRR